MILSVSLLEKVHLLSVTENLLAVSQYSREKKASTGIMYKNETILFKFHIQI